MNPSEVLRSTCRPSLRPNNGKRGRCQGPRTSWPIAAFLFLYGLSCLWPMTVYAKDHPESADRCARSFQVFVSNSAIVQGSIIDSATNTVVAMFDQGDRGDGIAITHKHHRAYVAHFGFSGPGSVAVIDTRTGAVIATIPTPIAAHSLAIAPDGKLVFVTSELADSVFVIESKDNILTDVIPVGRHPDRLAVSPEGDRVYVANAFSDTVSVIDTETRTVVDTVVLPPFPMAGRPFGVAVSPSGDFVYVTNQNAATVSVIDAATDTVVATISVTFAPQEIAITPDGAFAVVASGFFNVVSFIDLSNNHVVATLPIGSGGSLSSLAITPDGKFAYLTFAPNQMIVVDINTRSEVARVNLGPTGPSGVAIQPARGEDEEDDACSDN